MILNRNAKSLWYALLSTNQRLLLGGLALVADLQLLRISVPRACRLCSDTSTTRSFLKITLTVRQLLMGDCMFQGLREASSLYIECKPWRACLDTPLHHVDRYTAVFYKANKGNARYSAFHDIGSLGDYA